MIKAASFPFLAASVFALAACDALAEDSAATTVDASPQQVGVETLSARDLSRLIDQGRVVLVDVRSPGEFDEQRLPGALNAPLETFDPAMIPMEADRETILYCRSDRRSRIAAEKLAAETGASVRHLRGGILAWQDANLPVLD